MLYYLTLESCKPFNKQHGSTLIAKVTLASSLSQVNKYENKNLMLHNIHSSCRNTTKDVLLIIILLYTVTEKIQRTKGEKYMLKVY
jgi:hypothetical protein